jgi:hypothetical protein
VRSYFPEALKGRQIPAVLAHLLLQTLAIDIHSGRDADFGDHHAVTSRADSFSKDRRVARSFPLRSVWILVAA